MMKRLPGLLIGLLMLPLPLMAGLDEGFDAALAADGRAQEERDRDADRRPREVLEFVGIGEGMTVLEIIAGGGWYTEVLAAAVGPTGKVIAQNGEYGRRRYAEAMAARAERLGNVERVYSEGAQLSLPSGADAAFTALNLHDVANNSEQAATGMLRAIHAALKPGGVLGIVDHAGKEGADNAALHRMEPAVAHRLMTEAGFIVEARSDVLASDADDLTSMVMSPDIRGKASRFVYRARKPAE